MNLLLPKRTHQVTIQTRKDEKKSKSFSLLCNNHTDRFIFKLIDTALSDDKLNRPVYFDTKFTSHVVILLNIKNKKTICKCYPLHQYSVGEICDILRCKLGGGSR